MRRSVVWSWALACLVCFLGSCQENQWAGDAGVDGDVEEDADFTEDSDLDGSSDGSADGDSDGDADGDADGDSDGDSDGDADGDSDGDADGDADGDPCEPIAGVTYGTLTISGPPTDRPAAEHGDINLLLREWRIVSATRDLVDVDGPTDSNAPKLYSLYEDDSYHGVDEVYQVQGWDWGCNCAVDYMSEPEVTLAGLSFTAGEVVQTPHSGYDIGLGYAAIVLYATEETITLKYTSEDNVVWGYTIHLTGLCVEPSLVALYESCNSAGRGELPALLPDQPLGRARGEAVLVAIRDTGSWMDPRVRKDWW